MRENQASWTPRRPSRGLTERQTCIPSQVIEVVPTCAITCLESFIQTEYSTSCANTSSLEFLCITPNPSGFALGEAALRCVVSNCSSTSSEGAAYNICAGIMGSVPETMATITATIAPSSSTTAPLITSTLPPTLPPTIAQPSTTPVLTSFLSKTGSPSIISTTPAPLPPTSFRTSTIPISTTSSSTTQVNPEAATTTAGHAGKVEKKTLTTSEVVAISVGGVAVAATIFSVLFFLFCLRKKRKVNRPVSQRLSMGVFPPLPTGKDTREVSAIPNSQLSPNQRFYASATPEENRRSFWRKSINPVDIGVAVSPGKMEQVSPRSISSEKSASGLLANSEGPSMWPAPLMNFPPPPKGVPGRSGQAIPVFDEQQARVPFNSNPTYSVHAPYETRISQPPQQLTQASYSRPFNAVPRVSIQAPYETRLTRLPNQMTSARAVPPPVASHNQAYDAERARGAAIIGRIPLTPIYDNGNFATTSQNRNSPVAYRWDTPESMNQLSVPQVTTRAPMGLNISNAVPQAAPPRKISHKSEESDSTTFEEDTTPEEERDRQLRLVQARSISQYATDTLARIPEGDASPIKNIAYPQVPRPAAVSRQAQRVPRPLAGQNIDTAESVPAGISRGLSRRYELNRAGQSYVLSEGSSSSASAPSQLAQRRIGQQKDLRIKTPNTVANALDSRWQVSTQPAPPRAVRKEVPVRGLQPRPSLKETSPKAKVTPKTNSRGDLYLTVEG